MLRQDIFKTIGMNQDSSLSSPTTSMAYENMNLRLTTTDNNTLLQWTNEKGTKLIDKYKDAFNSKDATIYNSIMHFLHFIQDETLTIIGNTIIGNYLIIFAQGDEHDGKYDYILRVEFKEDIAYIGCLYCGNLNFDTLHPIECLTYYENEKIQKVYWVDGINPFRCIEVTHNNKQYSSSETFTSSDNIIEINNVEVVRDITSAVGLFPSGTIQYVFTGVNYYGAESNISYITPLHYISEDDTRGNSPESNNTILFKLKIDINNNSNWKYLKIYSIIRTSINGTPILKHIKTIEVTNATEYTVIDSNTTGEIIAPTDLLYVGSKTIIPQTIEQKDGTLFLGNYTLVNNLLNDTARITKKDFRNLKIQWSLSEKESIKALHDPVGEFPYDSSIKSDSFKATHFKNGEWYRFGIVLQYNTGETSEVIYIGDSKCNIPLQCNTEDSTYKAPIPTVTLTQPYVEYLRSNNIVNVIPVIVYTTYNDCSVLAQGVCNPTIYNVLDRNDNSPFSQPSWFFRPYPPGEVLRKSSLGYDYDYEEKFQIDLAYYASPEYRRNFEKLFNTDLIGNVKHEFFVTHSDGTKFNDDYELASLGGIIDNDGIISVSRDSLINSEDFLPVAEDLLYYGDYGYMSVTGEQRAYPVGLPYAVPQSYYTSKTSKTPFVISKFVREYYDKIVYNKDLPKYGSWIEFRHDLPIPSSSERNGEIQSNYIKDYFFTENYRDIGNALSNINSYTACTPYYRLEDDYDVYNKHGNPYSNLIYSSKEEYIKILGDKFFIDYNNITFHSPELEFDDTFLIRDYSKVKFRIIGIVPITSNVADYDIFTKEGPMPYSRTSEFPRGLVKEDLKINKLKFNTSSELGTANLGYRTLCSAPIWEDDIEDRYPIAGYETKKPSVRYVVYPWHSEYLNNGTTTGIIAHKTLYNNRYSYNNIYFNNQTTVETSDIKIPNLPIKIDKFNDGLVYYSTDIDKIIVPSIDKNPLLEKCKYYENDNGVLWDIPDPEKVKYKLLGYPIIISDLSLDKTENENGYMTNGILAYDSDSFSGAYRTMFNAILYDIYNIGAIYKDYDGTDEASIYSVPSSNAHGISSTLNNSQYGLSSLFWEMDEVGTKNKFISSPKVWSIQPCRIKYKSTQHALISLGNITINNKKYINVLPKLYGSNPIGKDSLTASSTFNLPEECYYFWDKEHELSGSYQEYLITDFEDWEDLGTGITTEYENYKYGYLLLGEFYRDVERAVIFGGNAESDIEANVWNIAGNNHRVDTDTLVIKWIQGDFYYQRYNHILSKPSSNDDKNSIFDSLSFMVETRINIDGVYSKNQFPIKSFVNYEHLNELNNSYSQYNNYFNYYSIDENKVNFETFVNSITWTKSKVAGAIVDNWLNITMATNLDLNGSYGEITSLKSINQTLLAFQKNATSIINFNSRVQIPTTDGVPIEIANNYKVDGYNVLSDSIGCQNKWSICSSPNKLYFIDNINKDIYYFDERGGIVPLASQKGMKGFILNNSTLKEWNPITQNNFIAYYDKKQQDIYFINKSYALAFNEGVDYFTSFYSYNGANYINTLNEYNIILKGTNIYLLREGEYNKFFGEYKPFYTEVIAGGFGGEKGASRLSDKIFNNIEFRSDSFDSNGNYLPLDTFDTLNVSNEYQNTKSLLIDDLDHPSNLRKKFRIWRAEIPRSIKGYDVNNNPIYSRDRIRNPWIKLRLGKERNLKNVKTVLHDLTVNYYD